MVHTLNNPEGIGILKVQKVIHTRVFVTSIAFAFIGDIVIVANITVFAVVITFAMINLSVIVLRYTEPQLERPFRVPLNIGKFPILPLVGFVVTVYMAIQFEMVIMAVGLGIIGVGVIFYLIFNRRRKVQ